MKSLQAKEDALQARTTDFTDPRLVVVTAFTDIDDPSTWTEHPDFATTDRPALSGAAFTGSSAFSAITTQATPDATDEATASEKRLTWPNTVDANGMNLGAYGGSGGNVQLLAVVDGTGALGSTTVAGVTDTPFGQAYTAVQNIIIAKNSQTVTEK